MAQIRSYRRRGSPDLPLAVYLDDFRAAHAHPIPEYHPEIEIVRLIRGHAVLQLDGVAHSFREGDVFIIPGNAVHYYQSFSPDAKWCSLIFAPEAITMHPGHYFQTDFVQPLIEGRLSLPTLLQPGHPAYDTVVQQMELILDSKIYAKGYKLRRFAALMVICTTLIPYCTLQNRDRPVIDPGNDAIRLCMRYIHNKYDQKITLEDLSSACHLHPHYLCTIFKRYTGQTLFDYITRFRIETAAQLLKNQGLPTGKVGEMVGFHSESLFYRKFKAIMGVTPKAYAKQLHQALELQKSATE